MTDVIGSCAAAFCLHLVLAPPLPHEGPPSIFPSDQRGNVAHEEWDNYNERDGGCTYLADVFEKGAKTGFPAFINGRDGGMYKVTYAECIVGRQREREKK